MLAGMPHRRKAGAAGTRFRGMNAAAETRERSRGTESGLQRLEDFPFFKYRRSRGDPLSAAAGRDDEGRGVLPGDPAGAEARSAHSLLAGTAEKGFF